MYPGNYKQRLNSARDHGVSCQVRVWQSCIIKAFALEFVFDPSTEIFVVVNKRGCLLSSGLDLTTF